MRYSDVIVPYCNKNPTLRKGGNLMKRRKLHRLIATVAALAITAGMLGATAPEREDGQAIGYEQEAEIEQEAIFDPFYGVSEEFMRGAALQVQAAQAWEVLSTLFEYGEGEIIYPHDYAGAWHDGRYLHIALTSDSSEWGRYRELLRDFDCIVFETAEHSLNDLTRLNLFLFFALSEAGYPLISSGVRESQNRINLTFSDLNSKIEEQARSFLSDMIEENDELFGSFSNRNRTMSDENEDLFTFGRGTPFVRNSRLEAGQGRA
jgi:hypothetical protein